MVGPVVMVDMAGSLVKMVQMTGTPETNVQIPDSSLTTVQMTGTPAVALNPFP